MRSVSLFLIFITPLASFAQFDFYQGIRQMGMGGAAIAVVNDETSLLLNPIGLGRLREPYVTLIDPEVTSNLGSVSTLQDLSVTGALDLEKLNNELQDDKRFFSRVQIFPSFADRNSGFGFLAKYDVTASRSTTTGLMNVNYLSDWALAMGINHSFWGGVVKIGAIGKFIDRVEFVGELNPATDNMDLKQIANEGMGIGADIGMSISSPTDWLPTLSVMVKDVGRTSFTLASGMRDYPSAVAPNAIPTTIDVALAIFPIHNAGLRSSFSVEMDDVNNHFEQLSKKQKLHVGYELNMFDQFFFRAGYNRGYLTGGFEWAFRYFQLQLAYYGEEIGDKDNPVKDERVAIKAAFRF